MVCEYQNLLKIFKENFQSKYYRKKFCESAPSRNYFVPSLGLIHNIFAHNNEIKRYNDIAIKR